MRKLSLLVVTCLVSMGLCAGMATASAENQTFIVRDASGTPQEVVDAIQEYVWADEDWIFLSSFGLKGGEVTAVKVCYLPLGGDIFAAGMHVAAMLPCGHIAVYEEDGQTRLSMLDLGFMTTLNPDPNLERAVEKGRPAFEAMLEAVLD